MASKKKAKPKAPKRPVVDIDDDELDDDESDVIFAVDEPSGNILTRLLFRPWLLVILAGAGLYWFGGSQLLRFLPDLTRRPEYRASVANVRINDPPEYVPPKFLQDVFDRAGFVGEISLTGRVRPAPAMPQRLAAARAAGVTTVFAAPADVSLAGIEVVPVRDVAQALSWAR